MKASDSASSPITSPIRTRAVAATDTGAGAGLAVGVGLRDVDGRRVAVGRRAAAAGTGRECPAARTALGSHL